MIIITITMKVKEIVPIWNKNWLFSATDLHYKNAVLYTNLLSFQCISLLWCFVHLLVFLCFHSTNNATVMSIQHSFIYMTPAEQRPMFL